MKMKNSGMKIFVMSGNVNASKSNFEKKEGIKIDGFITKPFNRNEIKELFEKCKLVD